MTKLSLAELREGDLIRVSRVVRVIEGARYTDIYGPFVDCIDEKDEHGFEIWEADYIKNTQNIEILHRPSRKPHVGDILTPAEVQKVMWKRGSVIQNVTTGAVITLMPDGTWVNSTRGYTGIEFSEFDNPYLDDDFEVLHVAH